MKKGLLLALMAFVLILSACNSNVSGTESAEGFPEKPIKIVVGFEAGGGSDTVARIIAKELGKHLDNDVNIVVENKPGGSGVVAMTEVINANPDGYTIGFSPTGPMVLQTNYGQTTYEYNEAVPISQVNSVDFMLAVHKDSPWDDVESFIKDAQDNPGKYSYGMPGAGTLGEISMLALAQETGIEVKAVPFKGGAPTRTALLGKDVDAIVINDDDIVPYTKNGELKVLMNFGQKKFDSLPDVPTAQEKGYDLNSNIGYILYGPNGLPTEIRDKIDNAVQKMVEEESVQESLTKVGIPADYMNATERTELLETEYHLYKDIIGNSGE